MIFDIICELLHRSVAPKHFCIGPRNVLSGVYAESLNLGVQVGYVAWVRDRETVYTYGETVGARARAEARLVGTRF